MSTRLLLARHGETLWSLEGRFCGTTELPLTPNGMIQAKQLAKRLQQESINWIFCSPQQRARSTAGQIAVISQIEPDVYDDLREMNFGAWEGHTKAELATHFPHELALWESGSWLAACPGGETQQDVLVRGVRCLQELITNYPDQTLLIVAHRTVLRIALGHILGMSLPASRAIEMYPASLTEVKVGKHGTRLVRLNDTSHLH